MGRRLAWLIVALLAGCKDEKAKPKTSEERTADALAHVDEIAKVMPVLRRLSLDRPIPASHQTVSAFREVVRAGLGDAKAMEGHALALQSLGLIDAKTNVARAIEDAWATQAAAYYNPKTKAFSLVMAPTDPLVFDSVTSHELTHGLQDQHWDLTTYLEGPKEKPLTADEQLARRFVVEGDAMLASVVYVFYAKTGEKELTGTAVDAIQKQLAKFANLDAAGMAAMLEQQLATAHVTDPEMKRSIAALPTIPAAILEPLMAPYMRGAAAVADVYESGRWDAVNRLYTDPPRSTAQMLHPATHLIGRRSEPRELHVPTFKPDGITLVESDVLGELMWGVYFGRWKHTGEVHPEHGWAGDRYAVWRADDGTTVTLISTAWDTIYDAEEFYAAYLSTLDVRYPDRAVGKGDEVRTDVRVRLVGDRVLIVDGDDVAIMDDLERDTGP